MMDRILEGREYGMSFRRHWYYGGEDTVKVRVVHVFLEHDQVEVKVVETRKPFSDWDTPPSIGEHYTVDSRQIVCEWEDIERYRQEQREARNNRPRRNYMWAASKWKRRKPSYMSKPGAKAWTPHRKENRTEANRRERHKTKQELHSG